MKKLSILFFLIFYGIVFGQINNSEQKLECSKDSIKALHDSKTQYKYYMNIAAPDGSEFLPKDELKNILEANKISWGGFWMGSDIGFYSGECYFLNMNKITENRFGKEFIDGLIKKSVKAYYKRQNQKYSGLSPIYVN